MSHNPTRRGVVAGAGALAAGLAAPWVSRAQQLQGRIQALHRGRASVPVGPRRERWADIVKEKTGGKST